MLQYSVQDRIARITLNYPEKRNALSPDLIITLTAAFREAQADDKVKVIILNANGNVFSAGADLAYLKSLQSNTYEENLTDSQKLMTLFELIYTLDKIVIAQIEGSAIAGGCGLATICDIVFATPDATFGYTEVRIGFIPAMVMIFLLRKIGETRAKELLLSGKLIDAPTAQTMGLINYVISRENIANEVTLYARHLCNEASAQALKTTKMMIGKVQTMALNDALQYAAQQNALARATDDCKYGINAFLNKEKLVW
ncbi:MAG: enoyl-CoA hydratase/isomerase family protein [Sphingobacteriales bacterium]|nr:enoyl-CoA hydratase/isomerase family protein [Sphingobacteriales bacterium]MCC7224277.1 enoyl-CoA hydratase/isomerase family protein [Chitinophagales bacterium]